jgi:Family of unknown function (DUF5678)
VALTSVLTFDHVEDPTEGSAASHAVPHVVVDWSAGSTGAPDLDVLAARSERTEPVDYRCAAVVVDADGTRLREVDVTFTERLVGPVRSRLVGSDASGSFRVDLEAELPVTEASFRFRFDPTPSATPSDLLPAVNFIDALDPARRLGLWSHSRRRWAAEPMTIPEDHPRLPDGYVATVEALTRIQGSARTTFPMPLTITEDDAVAIRQADALLAGSTSTGRWGSASVVVDQAGGDSIRSASEGFGAQFAFTTEYRAVIAGHIVPLGRMNVRLMQVRVAGVEPADEPGHVVVRLVPGADDRYETRLLGQHADAHGDEAGGALLELYAGRWVAQAGSTILAVGDTPSAVLEQLRNTGRTASVWRVPRSRREAEVLLSDSL